MTAGPWRLAIAAGAGLAALWAISTLTWPFGTDQGFWAWVWSEWRRGAVPYRDAFDVLGPAAYLLGGIPHLLFGITEWGPRLVELVWIALGAWAVGLHPAARARPWIAATVFALLYASMGYWDTVQPDAWAGVLLAIACVGVARAGPGETRPFAIAGVLVGVATLIKPSYGLFGLVPALDAWLRSRQGEGRLSTRWLVLTSAFLAALGTGVGVIAARQGLSALWEAAVLWPTQVYAARGAWPGRFIEVGTYLLSLPVVALLPLAGVAVLSGWRHQHREIVVLLAWIGLIFGVIIWNGHFLPYHWHPLFPPLAILTARAMAGDDRLWGRTSLTVALLVLGIAPLRQIARWARLETGRLTPDAYRALLLHEHFPTRTPIDSLIGYVRRTTSEQDRIFLWGENPALYALSGRRSASRFGSSRPLIEGPESPLTSRFRGELLTQLRASPPRLFLRHESGCEGDPGLVMSCTPLFPELQRFVDSGYVADTVVSDMVVFRRR